MSNLLINYEQFERHIKDILKITNFDDGLNELTKPFRESGEDFINISFPTLTSNVISLLEILTNDKNEWISYWIYELDCGKKYKEGCVVDANKKNIPLKTIKDLWNILINELLEE